MRTEARGEVPKDYAIQLAYFIILFMSHLKSIVPVRVRLLSRRPN